MKIPGLSFSLKRALGVTVVKQKIARKQAFHSQSREWSARLVVQ